MRSFDTSFCTKWITFAALRHAQRNRVFRGQKKLATRLDSMIAGMRSARTSFGRQLRLLQALRKREISTGGLCALLKVSRRTLFRDLAALRQMGIDISSDGERFSLRPKQLEAVLGKL